MASILVTGGTGNLGRHVLPLLRERGHDVRVLSRTPHSEPGFVLGDTVGGEGLDAAARGADTILHLAGSNKGDEVGTAHIADAARGAGVRHVVMISVVGADAVPIGYFRSKDQSEKVLAASGVPFTVLRAAQFHDFVWGMLGGLVKSPIVPVLGARFEPVAVEEVAGRLAELVDGEPAGRVADIAGPEVLEASTILHGIARARGVRRGYVPMPLPGSVGRAYREGANLAGPGVQRGTGTWEEYLQQRMTVPMAA